MKKMVTIDYQEYMKFTQTIDALRNNLNSLQLEKIKLDKEIAFLKDSGENILVIVKSQDKPDVHEYKTDEKNVLTDLVAENYRIRERYDELSRQIDNIENQKSMILLKYKEMESIYKNQITKLEDYIETLESRGFWSRIKNDTKNIKNLSFVSFEEPTMLESGPTKTIYSEEELLRLETEAKKVPKTRGWHFKEKYVDSEGNVYHKGKLQPHLKGTE